MRKDRAASESDSGSKEVLGRGSIYTLASAAPMLAGVVLLPVTTRLLSQEAYGIVAICLVLIQFGGILASFGLTISIIRHALLEGTGLPGARGIVVTSVATAAVAAVAALLTGHWWSSVLLGQPWQAAIQLAIGAAAAGAVVANVQAYLRAVDNAWMFVAIATAGTFVGPALGILFLSTTNASPKAYLLGLAIAYGCAAILGLIVVIRSGAVNLNHREVLKAFRIGLPTIPHQLALALATGAMVLIASSRLGVAASASLQIAFFVGTVPTVITSALNNAWAPLIMRTAEADRPHVINATARDIGWIAACASSGVALLAPWIVQVVTPSTYPHGDMVVVVGVVSLVAILSVLYLGSSHLIFVSGRTIGLAICTPVSVGCGAATALMLVGPFGLAGAASGFTTTYVVLAIGTYLLSRLVSPTNWSPTTLLWPLSFAIGGAAAGSLLPYGGPEAAIRMVLVVCVGLLGLRKLIKTWRRPAKA